MDKSNGRARRLRLRLNVLIAALLILTSVATLIVFQNNAVTKSVNQAYSTLENQAAQQKETILLGLTSRFDQLEVVAAGFSTLEEFEPARAANYLNAVANSVDFASTGCAGTDGMLYLSTGERADISQRAYYQSCLAGKSSLELVEQAILTKAPRLLFAVPIQRDGAAVGMVTGSFPLSWLGELLTVRSPQAGNYMYLCNEQGYFISHGNSENSAFNETVTNIYLDSAISDYGDEYDTASLKKNMAAGEAGLFHYQTAKGERYAAYVPLGMNGWVLFNTMPADIVMAQSWESTCAAVGSVAVLSAISLVLLLYIVRLMNRWNNDLQALQKYELSRLRSRAEADSLTGLLNSKTLRIRIDEYLRLEGRRGRHALFLIDLDEFKHINDTIGHPEGDRILMETAAQLKKTFRSSDIVGRIGGDEFMVMMRDAGSDAIVRLKAAELRENLRLLHTGKEGEPITCSMGAAVSDHQGTNFDQLYIKADRAMYGAKAKGKDTFVLFSDMDQVPLEPMRDFFAARVEGYDEHMLNHVEGCREGYRRMAKLLPEGISSLLDLGCGTGLEMEEIFARFPQVGVTGYDLTEAMLERLREKYSGRNVTTCCADYFTADFGVECFDAAVSFESLHHFSAERKLTLYRKIFNSLKAGGRFVNCDYMVLDQAEEEGLMARYNTMKHQQGLGEEWYHFDMPLTVDHEMELLRAAGFAKVTLVWRQRNTTLVAAEK